MPRWHDYASARAIADVRDMVREVQGRLGPAITGRAWISPFSVAMALDGQLRWRFALLPENVDDESVRSSAEALGVALVHQKDELRACAIMVSAGDDGSIPVMRLEGAHRESPPFIVVMPWRRDDTGQVIWLADDVLGGGWFGG
jgi:hypothetical protein